ncbi:MAG: histidine kinase dimerization/phospho-acceptor domain-containing protein, partial [Bacteroidota bacterium]|nr:histidine kinase dimerization/phospho-acceptor domain-containing protein [Bacteroidota bacterium]
MKPSYRFRSLRARMFLAMVLVALAPIVFYALFDYYGEVAAIEADASEKLRAVMQRKTAELDAWLDERIGDLETIAMMPGLRLTVRTLSATSGGTVEDAQVDEMRRFLRHVCDRYEAYGKAMLIDGASRRILLSTIRREEGSMLRSRAFEDGAYSLQGVTITDVYPGRRTDAQPEMFCSIPVGGVRSGESAGQVLLVLEIDLHNSLYNIILDYAGLGESGETLLVNGKGYAVTALRHDSDAALRRRIDAVPAIRARNGETGVERTKDYRGVTVLAAYTYLPRLHWGFVTKQDIEELHASYFDRITTFYIWLSAALVLAVFAAGILARSATGTLKQMVRSSERIASGAYHTRLEETRRDEFGKLAHSFNVMAEHIQTRISSAQREAELFHAGANARSPRRLGEALTRILQQQTGSLIVAFYVADAQSGALLPVATTGGTLETLPSFDTENPQGMLADAWLRKDISRLRLDTPRDLVYETVVGNIHPAEIAAVPLHEDGVLLGAVLLAKQFPYSDMEIDGLRSSTEEMTSMLRRVQAQAARDALAEELKDKNQELEAMAEELQQQSEELQYQNMMLEEQKRQLAEANRLKGEFLSNISHELRTPLNAILSLSRALALQAAERLSDEETEFLQIVRRNAQVLLQLINDLLDLARMESGKVDTSRERVDIAAVIGEIVEILRPLATEKHVALEADIPDQLPEIWLDQRSVRLIVQNVLGNAVKFTREGDVRLTLRCSNRKCIITIRDTGIGIAEEDVPHIFEEFRQVDGGTARAFEGAG